MKIMNTKTPDFVKNEHRWDFYRADRERWGDGPWINEPDKVQWVDSDAGYACLAVRAYRGGENDIVGLGHWCGYVGVPEGHPAFQKEDVAVSVHGGLTFSDFCQEDHERGVCHVPEVGMPDKVWWLGFDCAHLGDLSPGLVRTLKEVHINVAIGDTYRTLDYIQQECHQLATQLKAMEAK